MASDNQNDEELGKSTDAYSPDDLAETIDDPIPAEAPADSETDGDPSPDDIARACNKTLDEEQFDAAGVLKTVGELADTLDDDRLELAHNILTAKMRANETGDRNDFNIISDNDDVDLEGAFEESLPSRYDILSSIGAGGQGQVFEAFDNNFKRMVAVKFPHPKKMDTPEQERKFMREAQISGSLSHPNILPIFDLDISSGGLPYFTMRKADGISMEEAIEESRKSGTVHQRIASFYERSEIIIKVCDAVAYSHNQGVVHQDIKPANIILGSFGDISLIDWGTAITTEDRENGKARILGTPLYMAPEQARRESSDEATDIYNIGATLFHLLTLRYPLWADNLDEFWKRKRVGDYDHPTREELHAIPGPLLAIAEKCMSARVEDRYASSQDVASDLRKYQEGLSVAAYRDTFLHLLKRWYVRNTKVFWVGFAGILACFALVLMYVEERRRSQYQWQDVYREDVNNLKLAEFDAKWKFTYFHRWFNETAEELKLGSDRYPATIEAGAIHFNHNVSQLGMGCLNMIYREEEPGNVELSWDVTVEGDARETAGNINCFIAGDDRFNGYTFHVGGYGSNNTVTCTRRLKVLEQTYLAEPLRRGVAYHFCIQRENNYIRLFIDDVMVLSVFDVTPLAGKHNQHFGIEIAHINVVVDNLHVRRQPLPEKVRAIEVANSFFSEGYYEDAYKIYERTDRYLNDSEMKLQSSFGMAAALFEQGKPQEALARLRLLEDRSEDEYLRNLSRSQMLRYMLGNLKHEKHVEALIERFELSDSFDTSLRRQVLSMYFTFRASVMNARDEANNLDPEFIRAEFHKAAVLFKRFGLDRITILDYEDLARELHSLGYEEEVAYNYGWLTPFKATESMLVMKDYDSVIADYPFITQSYRLALIRKKDHQRIVDELPPQLPRVVESYLALGLEEEIEAIAAKDERVKGHLLKAREDWTGLLECDEHELLALAKLKRWEDLHALLKDKQRKVIDFRVFDEMLNSQQYDMILAYADVYQTSFCAASFLKPKNILDAQALAQACKVLELHSQKSGVHHRFSFIVDIIKPYLLYRSSGDDAPLRAHIARIKGNPRYTYVDAGMAFQASERTEPYLEKIGEFIRMKLSGDAGALQSLELAYQLMRKVEDIDVYKIHLIAKILEIERAE